MTIDLGEKAENAEIGSFEIADKSFHLYDAPSKEHFKLIDIFPKTNEQGDPEYGLGRYKFCLL